LENLVKLANYDSFQGKLAALDKMSKSSSYQKRNPNEAEFFEYMRHWHYVAIREMSTLEGFKLNPEWIQGRLRYWVPVSEIKSAIEFLTRNGYIQITQTGVVVPPKETLVCQGEMYETALSQFHKQMFSLAADSIEATPPPERNLVGFTLAIDSKRFDQAQKILNRAAEEIEDLERQAGGEARDTVYQVQLAVFPITKRSETP
jgi:uncharacterized protein (TIGR02147 family)